MIEIKELSKEFKVKQKQSFLKDLFKPDFKRIEAVKKISFSVESGEILGFIGPNGAGKTTTIKMLVGILWPTSGEIIVNGQVPYKDRKKYLYDVGVVFGQRKSLWPELSVYDNLELISSFYKIDKLTFKKRFSHLDKIMSIKEFSNNPFRKLSLGQQMRSELVGALIHSPKILFLDEPTIGMDIVAKYNFISLLKEINKNEKTTIILTSHDLHEIESLCKRIIVINKGSILYDGNINAIKSDKVVVTYEHSGKIMKKQVLKSKLKTFLNKIDLTGVTIEEVKLEDFVKQFYHP